MDNTPPSLSATPQEKNNKRDCLIGCLIVVAVIGLLFIITLGIAIYPAVSKGIKAGREFGRAVPMITQICLSRGITDENEHIEVITRVSAILGVQAANDSSITPTAISNLVECVIAERAKEKSERGNLVKRLLEAEAAEAGQTETLDENE